MDGTYKNLASNFLLIVGILMLTGLAFYLGKTAGNLEDIKNSLTDTITGYAVKDVSSFENKDFGTFTKAVCNTENGKQYCYDAFYARCNGQEYQLPINFTEQKAVSIIEN